MLTEVNIDACDPIHIEKITLRGRYTMMEFIFWFLLLLLSLSPNLTITHDQFVALPDMSGNALFCKLFW